MHESTPNPGPGRTTGAVPTWPLALLLGLSLMFVIAGWGLRLVCARLFLDPELFVGWKTTYGAAGFAVIGFLVFMRPWSYSIRRAGFGAMLLLVLLQGILLGQGALRLNRQIKSRYANGPYFSIREYVPAAQRPSDWPDPLKPALFDLGGGVQLAMSTVCFTDAALHTLPKTAAGALPQPTKDASTRPLTPEALRNVVALTRAMGYVRFFHPSDEAASAYWYQLTILGVQAIEDATTPQDLAHKLQAFFAPLAPTAQFLAPGETARQLEIPQGVTQVTRWRHNGMGPMNEGTNFPFSRSVRLADIAILWTVMQHFYPYFDVVQADWGAELPKALTLAAVASDEPGLLRILRTLVAPLQDGHGRIVPRTGEAELLPPVWLQMIDGRVYVKAGPPAIPRGSEVLAVDGELMPGRLARLRLETSAATEGWMAYRLEARVLSACPGPMARLAFRTPQGATEEVQVNLEEARPAPTPLAPVAELRPGVWYVDLDRLEREAFRTALPKLAAAKGVLFDLRGYPKMGPEFLSYLTNKPITSAHWLVPIITQPDGRDWRWDTRGRWYLEPLKPHLQGKIVFLTGGGAISYAESCLGIVEAYRFAEIVGEPSAGTNGNINPFQLPDGSKVYWTGMKVLKHDGSRHHGIGIQPTVLVRPTPQGLAQGRDEVLEKGLEVVSR